MCKGTLLGVASKGVEVTGAELDETAREKGEYCKNPYPKTVLGGSSSLSWLLGNAASAPESMAKTTQMSCKELQLNKTILGLLMN